MADSPENTPPSGPLAADVAPPGEVAAPGQLQLGDRRLAAIFAKRERGETLTASERGYLGAVKKRGKAKAVPAPASDNPLLETPPAPKPDSDNPLFEAAPAPADPAGGFNLSPADSVVIQNAAEAILDGMDTTTKLYIAHEARLAGADEKTVQAYEAAVALNPRNRDLMAKNSEPVVLALCKFFRCQPDKLASVLKNSAFMVGLFAHVTAVAATVKSIRESKKENAAPAKP